MSEPRPANLDPDPDPDVDHDHEPATLSESITTGAVVSWSGDDGETLLLPCSNDGPPAPVDLTIHYNLASRTALFKLRTTVELRRRGPRRTPIFIYIDPSRVQTLELADATPAVLPRQEEAAASAASATPGHDSLRLHFVMTRPADLVVPKNVPLRASQAAQAQLASVRLLARQTVFDVYLDSRRGGSTPQRGLLDSLCRAVSDRSLVSRDPSADVSTLYAGHGGRIVDLSHDTDQDHQHPASPGSFTENPPEYDSLGLPPAPPPPPPIHKGQ